MNAHPGRRQELLLSMSAIGEMPGCLSYVIALDADDADGLWITEIWTDEDSWKASLDLPHVQATIIKAKPLIAGFSHRQVTTPISGI